MKTTKVSSLTVLIILAATMANAGSLFSQVQVDDRVTATTVNNGKSVKVYQLRHIDAESAYRIMGTLLLGAEVQIAVETRTKSLVVMASEENHKRIAEVLGRLDQELGNASAGSSIHHPEPVNFMVKMIMDASVVDWAAKNSAPDQASLKMLEEIASQGLFEPFRDPRMVVSSFVRANPRGANPPAEKQPLEASSGKVTTEGSSTENACRLAVVGTLTELSKTSLMLDCKIVIEVPESKTADQSPEKRKILTARIESNTTLTRGHPVVLSVNSVEGRNCLIIVEIR
ncbi:MAG: secretin N-terminal domain-containing protein [Pirellulaceae bacterium]